MTEHTENNLPQPYRPSERRFNHYKALQQEVIVPDQTPEPKPKNLFSVTIIAASQEGDVMDEQQFLIDLIFKPEENGLKLRPAETQLLLSYIGEILKEIEAEEKLIAKEQE